MVKSVSVTRRILPPRQFSLRHILALPVLIAVFFPLLSILPATIEVAAIVCLSMIILAAMSTTVATGAIIGACVGGYAATTFSWNGVFGGMIAGSLATDLLKDSWLIGNRLSREPPIARLSPAEHGVPSWAFFTVGALALGALAASVVFGTIIILRLASDPIWPEVSTAVRWYFDRTVHAPWPFSGWASYTLAWWPIHAILILSAIASVSLHRRSNDPRRNIRTLEFVGAAHSLAALLMALYIIECFVSSFRVFEKYHPADTLYALFTVIARSTFVLITAAIAVLPLAGHLRCYLRRFGWLLAATAVGIADIALATLGTTYLLYYAWVVKGCVF